MGGFREAESTSEDRHDCESPMVEGPERVDPLVDGRVCKVAFGDEVEYLRMDSGLTQLIRGPFVKLGQINDPSVVRQDRSRSHLLQNLLLQERCRSGRTFPSQKLALWEEDGEESMPDELIIGGHSQPRPPHLHSRRSARAAVSFNHASCFSIPSTALSTGGFC